MAKEGGKNVLVYVGDAASSPTDFNLLAGQTNSRWNGSTGIIDARDKSSNDWAETVTSLNEARITVTGWANWPDTNALDVLRANWEAQTLTECRIVLNVAGANYTGMFRIETFEVGGETEGVTDYNIVLVLEGTPTYSAS